MLSPENHSRKRQERSGIDDHIPEVRIIARDQYDKDRSLRILPFELSPQQECRLRILWVDGHTNDAIESQVRIEEREITEEGYIIALSHININDEVGSRTQRELSFTPNGLIKWDYHENGIEMVIEDVGYLLRSD